MRRFTMLAIAGLALIAFACAGNDPTPTLQSQTISPPAPTVDPEAPVIIGGPPPAWPAEYVLRPSGDVEIRFAYPSGILDYIAPIFVHHFSSSSRVLLNREGRVTAHTINGADAASAICAVLSDDDLIAEVISRAAEIESAHVMFHREPLESGPCERGG